MKFLRPLHSGFTLAELLISLGILGVIATFTIPKVLNSQQNSEWNSKAKEAASILAQSVQMLQLEGNFSQNTRSADLQPYINYVSVDTISDIDHINGMDKLDCVDWHPCLRLANGGVVQLTTMQFAGTTPTNAINLYFDPDGQYSGSVGGVGKSVEFKIFYNGRLVSQDHAGTHCNSWSCPDNPAGGQDPPWFSW